MTNTWTIITDTNFITNLANFFSITNSVLSIIVILIGWLGFIIYKNKAIIKWNKNKLRQGKWINKVKIIGNENDVEQIN